MKRMLLIPGDGIGPEVMKEGERLIVALSRRYRCEFQLTHADWGAEKWLKEKVGIPAGELETLTSKYDAILFGALGDPRIPDMAHGREILLGLRMGLDLYINFRPIKLLSPTVSILRKPSKVDIAIFRENTEDIYFGGGGTFKKNTDEECSIDESIHTYKGVKRIIEAAFSYAQQAGRRQVTLVDKSNAIRFGGSLWQRIFAKVRGAYPEIAANHLFVDVAAMKMVQDPESFDVVVTSNLFGDILSDLGSALAGGLGLSASGNINPNTIALFEPVHGSAPDIAGLGVANPFAMFLSVALMMEHFGFVDMANAIEAAITTAIDSKHTTKDLGGTLTTQQAADWVIAHLTT